MAVSKFVQRKVEEERSRSSSADMPGKGTVSPFVQMKAEQEKARQQYAEELRPLLTEQHSIAMSQRAKSGSFGGSGGGRRYTQGFTGKRWSTHNEGDRISELLLGSQNGGKQEPEPLSWRDIFASYLGGGDSSLPANNTTAAIQGIRQNEESIRKDIANREQIEQRKTERQRELAALSRVHPWIASAASVGSSMLGGTDILQQLVDMNAVGESIPRENLSPSEATETIRGGVSQDMGTVGKLLYGTVMSGVDSVTAGALGGRVPFVGGGILAGNAASSTMNDIKAKGGSDQQAVIGGVASGVFEALFENLSIGQLDALKELPVDSAKTLIQNLVKSMVTNASEEAATELANTIFDSLYMKELSSYSLAVKRYLANGASETEARDRAKKDAALQIAESALSGALMGVGMGAVGSGIGALNNGTWQDSSRLNAQKDGIAPGDTGIPLETETPATGRETAGGGAVESGIIPFDSNEAQNLTSAKGVVNGYGMSFRQFIDNAKSLGNAVRFYFGKVSDTLGAQIRTVVGKNVSGYNIVMRSDEVSHTLRSHGNETYEAKRGQLAVTPDALARLPEIFNRPDEIVLLDKKDYAGRTAFEARKWIDGYMVAVVGISDGKHSIEVDSVRIINKKAPPATVDETGTSPDHTSETGGRPALSDTTIPQRDGAVNKEAAVPTSDGRASPKGTVDTVVSSATSETTIPQEAGAVNGEPGSRAEMYVQRLERRGVAPVQAEQMGMWLAETERGGRLTAMQAQMIEGEPEARALLEILRAKGKKPKEVEAVSKTLEPGYHGGATGAIMTPQEAGMLDRLGKAAGVAIQAVPPTGDGRQGWYQNGRVYIAEDAQDPVLAVARHEITHRLQETAPEQYRAFRDYAAQVMERRGGVQEQIEAITDLYARNGQELTAEEALDELAADFAGELLTDEAAIRRLAGEDRTLGQRIRDAIHDLLRRIRAALGGEEARTLERAARLWDQTLEASQDSQIAGDGGTRYAIAPGFAEEVDRWDGVTDTYFRLGTTSDALRSIGLEEKEIVMRSAKATEILNKHAGMSREIIKQIPNILEDPVLVLNSRSASQENGGKSSRIVAFGQVYDADGAPVTAVLELRPTLGGGEVQDYQLLVSAYGKNKNLHRMVEESQALYLDPDKNRTDTWLHGLGLQSPSYETRYGPVGTVSYADGYVNIQGVPWKNITQDITSSYGENHKKAPALPRQYQNSTAKAENRPVRVPTDASLDSISQGGGAVNGEVSENGRYSVKGAKDLQKQVELLQRQNARLKEQMKRTGVPKANHQAVARQAREILSAYSSEYDKGKLTDRMESLYTDMSAKGGSIWEQDQAPTWEELRQSARKLAEDILAESWENVNSLTAEYKDFQKELRGWAITLSPQDRADLESVGGYEAFRKRYFGRLRLTNQGTPVDTVYQELAERWPELLPDDIVHPADQLIRMADMLDELAPVMGNAYEADMDRTAEYLAGDILERFYDTPQENLTFADRQARQRKEQRQRDREAFQDRMNRQRFASDQKLKKLKEKHRQQNRERTEKQTDAQWRETIRRGTARLSRKLMKPTNSSHIPEKLQGTVLNFLRSVDTSSRFEYVFGPDAKYHRVAAGTALGAEPATRTEAARALQAGYEELAAEGGLTVDPDMKSYLDLLADMGNITLDEMSHDQLDTVRKVLRVIEHTVSQADELLQESKFRTVSDMARALREENGGKRDRRDYAGGVGALDKLLNLDMLTPETFLHRMGSAGEDLYRQMRLADDQKTRIIQEATDRGRELIRESGVDFSEADKELHTFQLEDGDLTLSTSQIMELYALSHRQQAMEHIYIGGLLSRGNTGRFGVKLEKSRAVKVSPVDVANILHTLTPEQKALMDDLQSYLSGDLAEHGNRTSLAVYGYKKFKERNYWPIRVSREQVGSNPAQKAAAKTIPGFGMTKSLTEHANNAVELRSAADTFSDHVTQMATYAAWLGTSENVTRLMNHTYTADGGGWRAGEGRSRDGTVKELMRQVYGEGGQTYLEKLLGDVAGGTKAVRDTNFSMGSMTSAFKASAVGGNLRVILQQPTAILRAAEMMDPKYLLAGMSRRGGWKKALEHSPIAQWKDWGYFEMDTGRSVREIMLGTEGALNKAQSAMMVPAGWADGIAWGALWNAVEAETRAEHKELGENTQAFYDRCNERFSEIIDRTQVVDTVLHRSQAMRSQSDLYKMATSFMSEPTKIYNEIARGVYDFTQAESKADRVKAAKGLGRKALALTLSFAVNAVAQSLPDAWRDKEREKNFWGRFGENWVENFLDNYNPIGYIPFLKDGLSVFQGYDVARMDMEVFSDIVSSAMQVQKAMAGEGKVTLGYASLELALQACRALGLPLANIKRDIVGILSNGFLDLGLYEQSYELDKLMYREEGDQGRFVADLYRAMNGDDADYRAIYWDLEATLEKLYPGEGGEKLKAAMESRMKRDLGVTRSSSLPMRYSAPGTTPEFDRLVREGQSGGGWISALPEGAAELAGTLDAMEDAKALDRMVAIGDSPWSEVVKEDAMEANLTGKGLERYRAARRSGVSTYAYTDFLDRAYRAARRRTGKDSASPSQEDVSSALEAAKLTDRQRTAIWNSYGWKRESPWE